MSDAWLEAHRAEVRIIGRLGIGRVRVVRAGVYGDQGSFTITPDDLRAMVANFEKEVPIDMGHMSELGPGNGTIPPSGAPAYGWVKSLEFFAGTDSTPPTLFAEVSLLHAGRTYVMSRRPAFHVRQEDRDAAHAHLSAVVRLKARDRITGAPIGAVLQSLGLVKSKLLVPLDVPTTWDATPRIATPYPTPTGGS